MNPGRMPGRTRKISTPGRDTRIAVLFEKTGCFPKALPEIHTCFDSTTPFPDYSRGNAVPIRLSLHTTKHCAQLEPRCFKTFSITHTCPLAISVCW
jgi:hypothetical protein